MKRIIKYLLWAFGVAWILQIIAGVLFRKGYTNFIFIHTQYIGDRWNFTIRKQRYLCSIIRWNQRDSSNYLCTIS